MSLLWHITYFPNPFQTFCTITILMAQNNLICADVPLSNHSLTHWLSSGIMYCHVLQEYCENWRSTSIIQRPGSKPYWCGTIKVLL